MQNSGILANFTLLIVIKQLKNYVTCHLLDMLKIFFGV